MTKHRNDLALKAREAVDRARSILEADEDVRQAFSGTSAQIECIQIVIEELLGATAEAHRRECLNDLFERTLLLGSDIRREGAAAGIEPTE